MKQKIWKLLHKAQDPFNSIDDILGVLFKNRSLAQKSDIDLFLSPKLSNINLNIGDMDAVITRIQKAIENKEKIIVYGDYDADGVTATAIMWEGLYSLGANVRPYIPHREREGYGMSVYGVDYLIENEGVQLIITVDQGISAKNQIAYAQQKGIEVIVTDHHTKPSALPENCLIVHDHSVSGAAVSWKVVTRLLQHFDQPVDPQTNLPVKSMQLLDLVAIGLVCDLVPLQGESRTLVHYGLQQLQKTKRPGLHALAKQAQLDLKTAQTFHIGYIIGPRLNAMGRLEHAIDSLRLLCTTSESRATELADKLNFVNIDRKELTQQLINQARKQAEEQVANKILIIGDKTWNPGIIGLVASRMVEEFYKPTIVWGATEDHTDIYKASARSVKGYSIINAISESSEHLLSHGGHPMAAGFSLSPTKLTEFTKSINSHANKIITEQLLTPSLEIDCALPLPLVSNDLYAAIQQLKPFGTQAEEPLFASEKLEVLDARALGSENKHLKLKVCDTEHNYTPFEAIAFGLGAYNAEIRPGKPIDLAYHIDINEWKGKKTLQLKVRDLKVKTD